MRSTSASGQKLPPSPFCVTMVTITKLTLSQEHSLFCGRLRKPVRGKTSLNQIYPFVHLMVEPNVVVASHHLQLPMTWMYKYSLKLYHVICPGEARSTSLHQRCPSALKQLLMATTTEPLNGFLYLLFLL